jgi:hypothetical protein
VNANATIDRPDVEAFLAAVRDELADLGAEERDELLADVEASILESAEESDAPIAARLGPPADFAAELRAAAGLGGGQARARASLSLPLRQQLLEAWRSPRVAAARGVLRELAPIWWVARGYVVAGLVVWASTGSDPYPYEIYSYGETHLGIALVSLAVVTSIALGLWQRRRRGAYARATLAANLVLALLALPVFSNVQQWLTNRPVEVVIDTPVPIAGLANDGVPVENVYPYSREGRLLLDVLLFDQNGTPLYIRPGAGPGTDPQRRILRARDGAEVLNSYPIRYYEAGTRRVARPYAGPIVNWSPIATAPLERKGEASRAATKP